MKSYIITDSSQLEETPMRLYRIGGHGSRNHVWFSEDCCPVYLLQD